MRGFLLDENRAGVNLNSAGRMVSLFATEKNRHFVKCLCEFSFLLDRKFIAQQRNIIFFAPKPTPSSSHSSSAATGRRRAMGRMASAKKKTPSASRTHLSNVRTEEEFHDVIRPG